MPPKRVLSPSLCMTRLRSKTAVGLGLSKKGANPFLSCLLACPRVVDPQFLQICGRIQLFRQVLRELPDYVNTCLNCLATTRGCYKGPSRLLRSELSVLGLTLFGQSFHLVPLSTWSTFSPSFLVHGRTLLSIVRAWNL